jgi:hypothetical protein
MPFDSIIWDLDDDPDGNVQHCLQHGVTKEEVEEVFENATDAASAGPVAGPWCSETPAPADI